MLSLIGIGLWDEKDITQKGLDRIKDSDFVYLESYTSILSNHGSIIDSINKLSEFYGKQVISADRKLVEKNADEILDKAKEKNVCFLVIGDVFGATTHMDLLTRAKKAEIECEIIHNTSILTIVGETGLQLYKFGKTASIPFQTEKELIETPYNILKENQSIGAHTLFLLDLDPKNDKYLTIKQAIEYLLAVGDQVQSESGEKLVEKSMKCVACARLGSTDHTIKYATAEELTKIDFVRAPFCLIVPGKLHFMEEEVLQRFG